MCGPPLSRSVCNYLESCAPLENIPLGWKSVREVLLLHRLRLSFVCRSIHCCFCLLFCCFDWLLYCTARHRPQRVEPGGYRTRNQRPSAFWALLSTDHTIQSTTSRLPPSRGRQKNKKQRARETLRSWNLSILRDWPGLFPLSMSLLRCAVYMSTPSGLQPLRYWR